jgi:2-polyprenyl-6-methoxyphenol hydroxylase-like FAD-dependent oxidoreductase
VWELACDQVVNCRDDGTVGRIILLGDAAHMSSPRTGAGAYTAMKDAVVLGECLSGSTSLETALAMYNRAKTGFKSDSGVI